MKNKKVYCRNCKNFCFYSSRCKIGTVSTYTWFCKLTGDVYSEDSPKIKNANNDCGEFKRRWFILVELFYGRVPL
jgi:hypothetical protein